MRAIAICRGENESPFVARSHRDRRLNFVVTPSARRPRKIRGVGHANAVGIRRAAAVAQHAHLWVRTVRMNAATAGECLRPGTVMRLIARSTAGSTSGRWTLSGCVTEYSGMKAKPMFARTIA